MGISKKNCNKLHSKLVQKKNLKKTNKKKKTIKTHRRRKKRVMLRASGRWLLNDKEEEDNFFDAADLPADAPLVEVPRPDLGPDYININCDIFSNDKADTFTNVEITIDSAGPDSFWDQVQEAISNIELDKLPREFRKIEEIKFGDVRIDKTDMIFYLGIEDEAKISVFLAYDKVVVLEKRVGKTDEKDLDVRSYLIDKPREPYIKLIKYYNQRLHDKYGDKLTEKMFKRNKIVHLLNTEIIDMRTRDGQVIYSLEDNVINNDISEGDIIITWQLQAQKYRIDRDNIYPADENNIRLAPLEQHPTEWRRKIET